MVLGERCVQIERRDKIWRDKLQAVDGIVVPAKGLRRFRRQSFTANSSRGRLRRSHAARVWHRAPTKPTSTQAMYMTTIYVVFTSASPRKSGFHLMAKTFPAIVWKQYDSNRVDRQ